MTPTAKQQLEKVVATEEVYLNVISMLKEELYTL